MFESIKNELFKEKSFKSIHWQVFKRTIETVSFKKNEVVTAVGEIEKYLYFIDQGGVRLFYETEEKEINLTFIFEHHFASSYGSFLTQTPSKMSIKAIEDSVLFRLSYKSFNKLLKYRVGEKIARLNAETLYLDKENRDALLLLNTPDERYNLLLSEKKEWFQRIPQRHIASYLDLTPETISRIKKRNLLI